MCAGPVLRGRGGLSSPLLALVWAWLLVGERFGLVTEVGAVAVLVCAALTQRLR
ncbi:hypothetical protein AB0K60_33035 [Thermopolyspora sp. NPDC052614]|uniref:hypothetical protein n=1 Tax=Thermopolyspora sp. NPDC052614 TaxID=3155682 RepID=UPI00341D5869